MGAVNCNFSSIIIEDAVGLREGVKEARRLRLDKIIIQGDNLAIINMIRGVWNIPWEIRITMEDTLMDLFLFLEVLIHHC